MFITPPVVKLAAGGVPFHVPSSVAQVDKSYQGIKINKVRCDGKERC